MHKSNIVHLSTGYIQFADPTKPWTADNFPSLPSTTLSLGAQGRIEDGNINAITFTNAITYEPYEPQNLLPALSKVLQINNQGLVRYSELKVGMVSTVSAPFQKDVRAFQTSAIGAAHILDVSSATPDTLTNALGKLDSWIANAFLLQPPAVNAVEADTNSLYGGVRWLNFNTFSVFDKFVPYVSRILLTIGDPLTGNYCTLVISDPTLFPYKTYTDGISPQQTPLVKLRIFSDFFVQTADRLYTKDSMADGGFRVLDAYGNAVLPSTGNVIAVENTDASSTYTSVSVYLPLIGASYPKGSPIPVRIQFSNNTDGLTSVALTSTVQSLTGGPSAPFVSTVGSGVSSFGLQLSTPTYSDSIAGITDPYISSYTVKYTLDKMASADPVRQTGFRYGLANSEAKPASYSNITYAQTFPFSSTIEVTGTPANPLLCGAIWSTSVYATNSGRVQGAESAVRFISTLFPGESTTHISSANLYVPALPIVQPANSVRALSYTAGAGWKIGNTIPTDVYYISSSTALPYELTDAVQFNHPSYPGDQSTIRVEARLSGISTVALNISTMNYDFPLNAIKTATKDQHQISALVSDTQTVSTFKQFFYKVALSGTHSLSAISPTNQSLQVALTNRNIQGTPVSFSTPSYTFQTEPLNGCSTTKITYTACTSTTQICGLATPEKSAKLLYELEGVNFAHTYAGSNFGTGSLFQNTSSIGPLSAYSTNKIYAGLTEITTLPLPQNMVLRLSSCSAQISSNIYQNPLLPSAVTIGASVTPANPINRPSTIYASIPSLFIDTVSQRLSVKENGQRIRSMLPLAQYITAGTFNAIGDGVSNGAIGTGLDVPISTLVSVGTNSTFTINSAVTYNNASTLTADTYSRELLFTNGAYKHPAGLNFSQYSLSPLGLSSAGYAPYPNFTNDLASDSNDGYRYATFAYESPVYTTPTPFQYVHIRVKNPSLVSTIGATRASNTFFPDWPMNQYYTSSLMVRLHVKVLGSYSVGPSKSLETGWLNALKERDDYAYDDSQYDLGACIQSVMDGGDVIYTAQFNRRFFTKICPIVRVGISRDGAGARPITFDSVQVTYSDSFVAAPCS